MKTLNKSNIDRLIISLNNLDKFQLTALAVAALAELSTLKGSDTLDIIDNVKEVLERVREQNMIRN